MAVSDDFSLMSLEEELTCSICLSPFSCPVTIPCGHNFCQSCILETWIDSYSCPQCRTIFATKPELKKNTVLSTVVETFNQRASMAEVNLQPVEDQSQIIRCDTCMKAEASQTCLTCMASFCEEHLRPHRENPVFRLHQLSEPVGDLLERICSDHHKLMEFFCRQHGRAICSLCLQQVHKGCPFVSPDEQKTMMESELRCKVDFLDGKIAQNENVITQMKDLQNKMKESALNRKRSMSAEYQQIRDLLARDERDALNTVDRELESGQTKLKVLMKKMLGNVQNMNKAKEDIRCLLAQSQTLAFLQASIDLPAATNFDPYAPRINLDSKKVKTAQAFAFALREQLTEMMKQPIEDRQLILKPAQSAGTPEVAETQKQQKKPKVQTQGGSSPQTNFRPVPVNVGPHGNQASPHRVQEKPGFHPKEPKKTQKMTTKGPQNLARKDFQSSMDVMVEFGETLGGPRPAADLKHKPVSLDKSSDLTSVKERSELLKYLTNITLDPKTAHKRIVLSEASTRASVSDQHQNYPDSTERFSVCSQVLGSVGFSKGCVYWEVQLSCSNFIGIGLAYSNLDRKGPTSRLGRNAQSWCVEWFNIKLSAWHDSTETILANPVPKCVGVLLDCDNGTATFYNVADKAYPFHSFVFPFHGALYPAFWIFSSGSSISLRTVKA